jgi:hypothetical protein
MSDLTRWTGEQDVGPFRFKDTPVRDYIVITRRIVSPDDATPDRVFQRRGFAGDVGPLVEVTPDV